MDYSVNLLIISQHDTSTGPTAAQLLIESNFRKGDRGVDAIVTSAGLEASPDGVEMTDDAKALCREEGVPEGILSDHESHMLTTNDAADVDVILVMKESQKEQVAALIGNGLTNKTFLYSEYAGGTGDVTTLRDVRAHAHMIFHRFLTEPRDSLLSPPQSSEAA